MVVDERSRDEKQKRSAGLDSLERNGLATITELYNDKINAKMKKLPGEDFRISLLFNKYLVKSPNSGPSLISSCNVLIKNFEAPLKELKDALYKTRNIIVHNYRKVTSFPNSEQIIRSINNDFEQLISEVLTNYREIQVADTIPQDPLAWQLYQLYLES